MKFTTTLLTMVFLSSTALATDRHDEMTQDGVWDFRDSSMTDAMTNRLWLEEQKKNGVLAGNNSGGNSGSSSGSSGSGGGHTTIGNNTIINIQGNNNQLDINQDNKNSKQSSSSMINESSGTQIPNLSF